jgi:hypothetical protein
MFGVFTSPRAGCERGAPRAFGRVRALAVRSLPTAVLGALALAGPCATAQAAGGTVTRTYSEPGTERTFVVPAGVESVQVVAIGGEGGWDEEIEGGLGARVSGQLSVTPGSTLYVEVGADGADGVWTYGGEGGHSSDVRTAPRAHGLSPDDRLIVAGAGGGAGGGYEPGEGPKAGVGGAAGEEGGYGKDAEPGEAGWQSGGGLGGGSFGTFECRDERLGGDGALETGGSGGFCKADHIEGGAGGAGYYGGGGGGAGASGAGGGGGSSLVPVGGSETLSEEAPRVQIGYTQPPNPPAVTTEAATSVVAVSATLNATVNPEDEEVSGCSFEYGASTSYELSAPCSPSPGSGISPVAVSANVGGLKSATAYHYRIVATNADGTSHGGDETFETTPHEPPTLTAISPEQGPVAGGTSVTITGTELEEATSVKFGSNAAGITADSAESITAEAPAGTGTVNVVVTTRSGTTKATSADQFTYRPVPELRQLEPVDGPAAGGTSVRVEGTGFDAESTVSFGSTPAKAVKFESSRLIIAVSPAGVGTVLVTVTTPDGGTSAAGFSGTKFGYESGAPEYGRCVPQAITGDFKNSACTEATEGIAGGKYAWEPGVEKPGFTASSSGAAKFETTGKLKLTCTSATLAGKITGPASVGEVIVRFKGCESSAKACTTGGLGAGEIESATLEGALGWEAKSKGHVALDLYPDGRTGPFMQYTCSGAAATSVTGSVLIAVKAGKMETASKLKLKASKGKQKPEAFEGGERDVLLSSIGGGAAEQDGLSLSATQTNEEVVEIDTAV